MTLHQNALHAWVGRPPTNWRTDWLKWSVSLSTARPTEAEAEALPYIANEDIESWTGKLLRPDPEPVETDSRKFIRDDILFNKLRPYLAKVFHAGFDGVSSGELLCLRPSSDVFPRYLFYVVSSKAFVDAVNAETFGSKMPRADWEIVGHEPLPLPHLDTQMRIAAFLDEKTARIDTLIEKKRALLDRMAEKRQAIITHAVTKGLNPAAPMKDSGIDWLGQIPTHWEVKRLRFVGRSQNGINIGGEFFGTGYPFVSYSDVYKNFSLPTSVTGLVESSEEDRLRYSVRRGDILFTRTSETIEEIGFSAVCLQNIEDATFAGFLIRVRPWTDTLAPEFSKYYFRQTGFRAFLVKEMNLVTRASLGQGLLGDLPVLLPPEEEQRQIGQTVDEKVQGLDQICRSVAKSVEALSHYRSALITAAVTGQIEGLR
jgi:type I restriction enzyme S subunit